MYNQSLLLENKTVYINKQSNHPPNIMSDIPKALSKGNKNVIDRNIHIMVPNSIKRYWH